MIENRGSRVNRDSTKKEKIVTKIKIYPNGIIIKNKNSYPYFFIQNTAYENYRISTSFEYLNKTLDLKINIIREFQDIKEKIYKIFNKSLSKPFLVIDNTEESKEINKGTVNNTINIYRYQDGEEVIFLIRKIYETDKFIENTSESLLYFGKKYSSLNKYIKYANY